MRDKIDQVKRLKVLHDEIAQYTASFFWNDVDMGLLHVRWRDELEAVLRRSRAVQSYTLEQISEALRPHQMGVGVGAQGRLHIYAPAEALGEAAESRAVLPELFICEKCGAEYDRVSGVCINTVKRGGELDYCGGRLIAKALSPDTDTAPSQENDR